MLLRKSARAKKKRGPLSEIAHCERFGWSLIDQSDKEDIMKIGLQVPNFTWPGGPTNIATKLAEIATAADEAGFASLWVMDHFFQIGGRNPQSGLGPAEDEMLERL